jgi:hypothetical protein
MIPAGSGHCSTTADGDSAFAMSSLAPETKTRLQSINRFLEDIYGYPRRPSDILRDAGMGQDEIAQLVVITWIPTWPGCSGVGNRGWRRSCPHDATTSSSTATV